MYRFSQLIGIVLFGISATVFGSSSILSNTILDSIVADQKYTDKELSALKVDFQEYYNEVALPRINNTQGYILDGSIQKLTNTHYVIWTEGVAPSSWGGKEYIYVVKADNNGNEIVSKLMLDPEPSRTADQYRKSEFWLHPNAGCGYNDFVHGVLQYMTIGGSGSTTTQVFVQYDRYSDEYELKAQHSPVFYSKPDCK